MSRQSSIRILIITGIFAMAMGYLESAVVIYIREIYYPEGFAFPMKLMSDTLITTEIFRELATMIMLGGIGLLAARTSFQRFGIFLYAFGIWDIFYYIFLKILIGWPENLLTWDILFMIPSTWVGPVIAPSINALTMIILGAGLYGFHGRGKRSGLSRVEWTLLVAGSLVLLFTYMEDYTRYVASRAGLSNALFPTDHEAMAVLISGYIPADFAWTWFIVGQGLILVAVVLFFYRNVKDSPPGPLSIRL